MFLGQALWDCCSLFPASCRSSSPHPGHSSSLLPGTYFLHLPVLLQRRCGIGKSFVSSPSFLLEEKSIYKSLFSALLSGQPHCCGSAACICIWFLPSRGSPSHTCSLPACPVPLPNTEGSQHFPFPVLHPNSRQLSISVPLQADRFPPISLTTSSPHPPPLSQASVSASRGVLSCYHSPHRQLSPHK